MNLVSDFSDSLKAGHLNHLVAFSSLLMLPFVFIGYYLNKIEVKEQFQKKDSPYNKSLKPTNPAQGDR